MIRRPISALFCFALLSQIVFGCADGRGVITVHVTAPAPIPGIDSVSITIENGGTMSGPAVRAIPNGPQAIPPEQTFAIAFMADRQGEVVVTVDALAGSTRVATGTGRGTLQPSMIGEITVTLGDVSSQDLGMPDLGVADLSMADLSMCGGVGQPCCPNGTCNFGCCSQGSCQPGNASGACGTSGACTDCGSSLMGLACLAGKCGCSAGVQCPMQNACDVTTNTCTNLCNGNTTTCNGGCCANGQCVVGTGDNLCGGSGGFCTDCSSASVGHVCMGGMCGCTRATDCAVGYACDLNTHACTLNCAGQFFCNGGCCDGNVCVPGHVNSACGGNGGLCVACGGSLPTCTAGTCTSTCVPGMGMNGSCGAGSCCNAMNVCSPIANAACGLAGGACVDCTRSAAGPVCNIMSGVCGCTQTKDCPVGQACKAGVCGAACDAKSLCNGSCCDGKSNTCAPGTIGSACGVAGAMCADCGANGSGHACVAGRCGCTTFADCQVNSACDPQSSTCGANCDSSTACNGGCCSAANAGMCVAGSSNGACGANGGVCLNCAGVGTGQLCVATMGGGFCGCKDNSNCINNRACNAMSFVCTTSCSNASPCNSGCCPPGMLSTCQLGTSNSFCGANGSACVDCSVSVAGHVCIANTEQCGCNGPADCPVGSACNLMTHVCSARCDANTPCNTGCCSAAMNGTCLAGSGPMACGAAGVCSDCSVSNAGHQCASGLCGCSVAGDCPVQTACNTTTHVCESACGLAHSVCNGGCCDGTTCLAGTANGACGATGKTCTACANGTPTCLNGACSPNCNGNGQGTCSGGTCCAGGMCVSGNVAGSCGSSGTCAICGGAPTGNLCVNLAKGYACGCAASKDCNANLACDTAAGQCTAVCTPLQLCNGGCCSGGKCSVGNVAAACGSGGGACNACGASVSGHSCVNGACGCNVSTDCPANHSCNTLTHLCTQQCGAGNMTPCNGGCCNAKGTCALGGDATACGASGSVCLDCTAPNLVGHACVAGACGCTGNGNCDGSAKCIGSLCCSPRGSGCSKLLAPCCSGTTCNFGLCL